MAKRVKTQLGAAFKKADADENGELTKEVMPDFLHPREKGYAMWAEAMEEKLCELGGWEPVK